MSAERTRSIGFVCGPQRLFFLFGFVLFFYFLLPSSGRCLAWQPPARTARQVVFDSSPFLLTWTPLGFSPFPRHGPTSFLLLFNSVSLFSFFFLFLFLFIFSLFTAVYFCNGNIDPPTQRPINQNSLQQANGEKIDPPADFPYSIQVKKKSRLSQFRMTSR